MLFRGVTDQRKGAEAPMPTDNGSAAMDDRGTEDCLRGEAIEVLGRNCRDNAPHQDTQRHRRGLSSVDDTKARPDDAAITVIQVRSRIDLIARTPEAMHRAGGADGIRSGRGMETGQTHRRPDLHL